MKRLTLCTATSRSHDTLTRLRDLRTVADEIIVVSYGAASISLAEDCQSIGARLLSPPASNEAEALNAAMQHATGDWILWLSEGESVEAADIYKLRDSLYMDQWDAIYVQVSYPIRYSECYGHRLDVPQCRIVRNRSKIGFLALAHRTISDLPAIVIPPSNQRVGAMPIRCYSPSSISRRNAIERRSAPQRRAKLVSTATMSNPWALYALAAEYARNERFELAYRTINDAIKLFLQADYVPPAFIYKLKYAVLIHTPQFGKAIQGTELALRMYADYAELKYIQGCAFKLNRKYTSAIHCFELCTNAFETDHRYLNSPGIQTYLSAFQKGACQEQLGLNNEAIRSYTQSASFDSAFKPAIDALNRLAPEDQQTTADLLSDMQSSLETTV